MTNQEVMTLQAGLNAVMSLTGVRFTNGVTRNSIRIKRYMKERENYINNNFEQDVYNKLNQEVQKDRVEVCEQYVKRDKKGDPILIKDEMKRSIYDIPEEVKEEFNKVLEEKIRERQEVLDGMMKEKQALVQKWNAEESTLELYMIPESYVPEEITSKQLENIAWMIEELAEELKGISSPPSNKPLGKTKPIN